jgi:hypothetical protein
MWSTKKFIIALAIAAVLAIVSIGGVVLAQEKEENSPTEKFGEFIDEVCAIYEDNTGGDIDPEALKEAIAQAQTDRQTAAMEARLASVATREARIAGANLFHPRRRRNQGTIGVFGTMIADTATGVAGLTERGARDLGFDLVIGEAAAVDRHPGAMPGARELRVKLIFDRSSAKLIGGEACGGVTAGEIANVMAQAIAAGMTASDIATSQVGTHPALTASPLVYQIVNAAEEAVTKLQ